MINYELSYWEWDQYLREVDFLIIGGGIVGLSAAIRIKEMEQSAKVTVMERGPLPIGASTRNAGFACFGSMTELLDDLQHAPEAEVVELVQKRYDGLQRLRSRFGEKAIGYQELGGYEIFRSNEVELFDNCLAKRAHLNDLLAPITGQKETFVDASSKQTAFQFGQVRHLLLNQAEGQLDTGCLMYALQLRAQQLGVRFLGGVPLDSWQDGNDGVQVKTKQGWEVSVKRLLVATNGFAGQWLPDWDLQPARNQVLVTEPVDDLPFSGCFHYDRGYYYFRNLGNRVLLGGGRHLDREGETTTEFGEHSMIREALKTLLATVILPGRKVKIERWWTGIMGVGARKTPLVEAVGPHSVAAVRLGGMGVALGTWVGESGADMLLGLK